MPLTAQDLVEQLKRQLMFLRNSVASFDKGDEAEAIRVAVMIRVLLHDTKDSTSLLQHMGQKSTVQVVSTAFPLPADYAKYTTCELLRAQTIGDSIRYDRLPVANSTLVTAATWWTEPVFVRDGRIFTRRDVVLTAANKDGGAHVSEPNAKLIDLKQGMWQQTLTAADGTTTTSMVENDHFRMLRRLADELQNSPDLHALAK